MQIKNKTLATYIALFFGLFGMHYFYLNKNKKIAIFHICASLLFILGFILFKIDVNSIFVWILLWVGMLNWCSVWLTSIYYGLMTEDKWLIYAKFDKNLYPNIALDLTPAKTNGLTVLCVILALLIGMGSLMALLSFSLQNYYI